LKTTIFYTASILRKLFVKLRDTNESNARKITKFERQVAKNAARGEVKQGRTQNNIAESSSAPARVTHRPPEEVTPPCGRNAKRYAEALGGNLSSKVTSSS
jgi:hypothetical protein